MTIKTYAEIEQGSDEWHALRCGILTASSIKTILTPTLKIASNEKERIHLYELLAQRITQYTEPSYYNDDMLRGHEDEIEARDAYSFHFAPVHQVGFVTNDEWGFVIGCSPDGLVGDDGMIEVKSRLQKYQAQTIITDEVPEEYVLQIQTGLLVTGRAWCDYISYCGGMPMYVKRVYPDAKIHEAIIAAATGFNERLEKNLAIYRDNAARFIPTERKIEQEIVI